MKFTREGKRFLLATVLIAVAAFNTGNNLIYLILAMMLSLLAISAVALVLNMRGLSLGVSLKGSVFAGQAADMEISVENKKKVLPSYSIRVIFPRGMKGEGHVAYAAASSTARADCRVSFERRGVYSWGDFVVQSGFPFIFLTRRVRVHLEGTVTVYPRIVDVESPSLFSGDGRSAYTTRPGRGEDLLTIREFRDGDDVKRISWKASAKAQGLMVREFAEEQPQAVTIILDDVKPFDGDAFERAVSYAASLAARLIEEGFYVGLATSVKALPYGSGPEQLLNVLDVLAVAKETGTAPSPLPADEIGASVLVLKSGTSPMRGFFTADLVIDASEL